MHNFKQILLNVPVIASEQANKLRATVCVCRYARDKQKCAQLRTRDAIWIIYF